MTNQSDLVLVACEHLNISDTINDIRKMLASTPQKRPTWLNVIIDLLDDGVNPDDFKGVSNTNSLESFFAEKIKRKNFQVILAVIEDKRLSAYAICNETGIKSHTVKACMQELVNNGSVEMTTKHNRQLYQKIRSASTATLFA